MVAMYFLDPREQGIQFLEQGSYDLPLYPVWMFAWPDYSANGGMYDLVATAESPILLINMWLWWDMPQFESFDDCEIYNTLTNEQFEYDSVNRTFLHTIRKEK